MKQNQDLVKDYKKELKEGISFNKLIREAMSLHNQDKTNKWVRIQSKKYPGTSYQFYNSNQNITQDESIPTNAIFIRSIIYVGTCHIQDKRIDFKHNKRR